MFHIASVKCCGDGAHCTSRIRLHAAPPLTVAQGLFVRSGVALRLQYRQSHTSTQWRGEASRCGALQPSKSDQGFKPCPDLASAWAS